MRHWALPRRQRGGSDEGNRDGMKRMAGLVAAGALVMAGSVACGGGGSGSASGNYCDDIKSAKANLSGLNAGNLTQANFDKLASSLDSIRDEAPSNVKAQWVTVTSAIDTFNTALKSAGISMDDISKMEAGNMPPGMDMSKMHDVMTAARSVNTDAFSNAQHALDTEVQSTCHVDLSS